MAKGKKFDAAEKHFLKQKETLDRQIRNLRELLQNMTEDRDRFARRYELEAKENEELRKQIEALKKATGLSQSEVRSLIKSAESVNAVSGLLKATAGLG